MWMLRGAHARVRAPDRRAGGRARSACTAARGRSLYVLEERSTSDLLALEIACMQGALRRPGKRLKLRGLDLPHSAVALERRAGVLRRRADRRTPPELARAVAAAGADPVLELDIVPVAVYWGRAPQREKSFLGLLFSENWAFVGPFRRLLSIVFNGRGTLIRFGEPRPIQGYAAAGPDGARGARKLLKDMRAEFRHMRVDTLGPDLSRQRAIIAQVLRTRAVRQAVRQEIRDTKRTRRDGLLVARKHALEIAANYSHTFVRIADRILSRFLTRVYDGIEVQERRVPRPAAAGLRDRLHALPPEPRRLPAAVVRDLQARLRRAVRGRGREPEPAGDRPPAAQGRGFLHPPQLPRLGPVPDRVHEVRGRDDESRPPDRVLHRGRPQPHRPAAAAAHRDAQHDRAQLPARHAPPGRLRAGLFRLRQAAGRGVVHRRADGTPEGEGIGRRPVRRAARAAQAARAGLRGLRRAAAARCDARPGAGRTGAETPSARMRGRPGSARPWMPSPPRSCGASTPPPRSRR